MPKLKQLLVSIRNGEIKQVLVASELTFPDLTSIFPWVAGLTGAVCLATLGGHLTALYGDEYIRDKDSRRTTRFKNKELQAPFPTYAEYRVILDRNLFDKDWKGEEIVEENTSGECGLPRESTLPYEMRGVIFTGDSRSSVALLHATKKRQGAAVEHGEELPGGIIVQEIFASKVHVLKKGETCPEYISLLKPDAIQPRIYNPKRGSGGSSTSGATLDGFVEEGFERKGNKVTTTREYIEDTINDPDKFKEALYGVKASLITDSDGVKKFRLDNVIPGTIWEKLGIQSGDIVESINGLELNTPSGAIRTLQNMRNESYIALKIKRDGQARNLEVQVK